jgi:hypothetical protein
MQAELLADDAGQGTTDAVSLPASGLGQVGDRRTLRAAEKARSVSWRLVSGSGLITTM